MSTERATARREFLATSALALPAAVAGVATLRGGKAMPAGRESERAAGYRESAHILAYYKTVGL